MHPSLAEVPSFNFVLPPQADERVDKPHASLLDGALGPVDRNYRSDSISNLQSFDLITIVLHRILPSNSHLIPVSALTVADNRLLQIQNRTYHS